MGKGGVSRGECLEAYMHTNISYVNVFQYLAIKLVFQIFGFFAWWLGRQWVSVRWPLCSICLVLLYIYILIHRGPNQPDRLVTIGLKYDEAQQNQLKQICPNFFFFQVKDFLSKFPKVLRINYHIAFWRVILLKKILIYILVRKYANMILQNVNWLAQIILGKTLAQKS